MSQEIDDDLMRWPHIDVRLRLMRPDGDVRVQILTREDHTRYVQIVRTVDDERVAGISLKLDELDTVRMGLNECLRVTLGCDDLQALEALRVRKLFGLIKTAPIKRGKR